MVRLVNSNAQCVKLASKMAKIVKIINACHVLLESICLPIEISVSIVTNIVTRVRMRIAVHLAAMDITEMHVVINVLRHALVASLKLNVESVVPDGQELGASAMKETVLEIKS